MHSPPAEYDVLDTAASHEVQRSSSSRTGRFSNSTIHLVSQSLPTKFWTQSSANIQSNSPAADLAEKYCVCVNIWMTWRESDLGFCLWGSWIASDFTKAELWMWGSRADMKCAKIHFSFCKRLMIMIRGATVWDFHGMITIWENITVSWFHKVLHNYHNYYLKLQRHSMEWKQKSFLVEQTLNLI